MGTIVRISYTYAIYDQDSPTTTPFHVYDFLTTVFITCYCNYIILNHSFLDSFVSAPAVAERSKHDVGTTTLCYRLQTFTNILQIVHIIVHFVTESHFFLKCIASSLRKMPSLT